MSFQRSSVSPGEREKYRTRSPAESEPPDLKRAKEEKQGNESDAEKSDQDLVVDVATEEALSPGQQNGDRTDGVRENGDVKVKTERPPSRSGSSSNRSTPSLKSKEVSFLFFFAVLSGSFWRDGKLGTKEKILTFSLVREQIEETSVVFVCFGIEKKVGKEEGK